MTKENVLLANLFLNLKGNKEKREDWISIANTCQQIVNKSKTRKEAAKKLGVSPELIRSIISLLKLPDDVQQLVKEKKILFDAAQRINTLDDEERQIEVAKTIAGLNSHEQREIIQYAKKFPKSKLSNFKKRVTKPRETQKIRLAIVPLKDNTFSILQKERIRKRISMEKVILSIIDEWIKKKESKK